jgi:rsbT co-antagonist protein RsbR
MRIKSISKTAEKISKGELDIAIPITGNDEISSLARSFEKMRVSIHELVEKQSRTIDELSVSMIPFSEDIGVIVLIGVIDEMRLNQIRKNITEDLAVRYHKFVIIDISNVPDIDEITGKGIIKIAKTVSLMGSNIIVSGIHSSMAFDITNLDIEFRGLKTENTLQNAIAYALRVNKSQNKS